VEFQIYGAIAEKGSKDGRTYNFHNRKKSKQDLRAVRILICPAKKGDAQKIISVLPGKAPGKNSRGAKGAPDFLHGGPWTILASPPPLAASLWAPEKAILKKALLSFLELSFKTINCSRR